MANIEWIADSTKAWSDTSAWQGGALPTTGDNAIFDKTHVGSVTNLATGAGDPDNVYVKAGYTGDMGTSGNPLEVDFTHMDYAGSGTEAWFTSTCDTVIAHHSGFGGSALNLTLTQSGGEEFVACTNGRTNLFGTIETVYMARDASGSIPTVHIDSTVTLNNEIYQSDGTLVQGAAMTTFFHQTGGTSTLTNAGTYGLIDIAGGRCNIVVAGDVTIGLAQVSGGGSLDASGVDGDLNWQSILFVGAKSFCNADNGRPPTGAPNPAVVAPGGRLKYFAQSITPWKL